jgi:hypothetical protein
MFPTQGWGQRSDFVGNVILPVVGGSPQRNVPRRKVRAPQGRALPNGKAGVGVSPDGKCHRNDTAERRLPARVVRVKSRGKSSRSSVERREKANPARRKAKVSDPLLRGTGPVPMPQGSSLRSPLEPVRKKGPREMIRKPEPGVSPVSGGQNSVYRPPQTPHGVAGRSPISGPF